LETASLETHAEAMARLRRRVRIPESDMFRSEGQLDDAAYSLQEARIAYVEPAQAK
jgi:hypothetical protein